MLDVDYLGVDSGNSIAIDRVLVIGEGEKVNIGKPLIEGASVVATSQGLAKGDKIIVFRYKSKVRERRKTGHRQLYTRILIDRIIEPGASEEEPAKKPRRRKKAAEDQKEVAENGT